MELRQYWWIIWRWKWLIVLAVVLASASAYVFSSIQTPVYEASTTLLINEAPSDRISDYTGLLTSLTYVRMLTQRPVLEETINRLDIDISPDVLEENVDVQLVSNTQLITVSIEHENPTQAAVIANMLVEIFAEQNEAMQVSRFAASKESLNQELAGLKELIQQTEDTIEDLETPLTNGARSELEASLVQYRQSYTNLLQSYESLRVAEAQSVSNVVQVESATPPKYPIRPRTTMNTLLAAVLGAMSAVGVIFLIEYLDTSIKTPDEVTTALQLPMLGLIGHIDVDQEKGPHVMQSPLSYIAEDFRKLRSNIKFAAVDQPIRTLLVASPGINDGKSTVACNLAITTSQDGKRVVLLDADLRRPSIHKIMGADNRMGLSDLFVLNPLSLDGVIPNWTSDVNLTLITSGDLPPNPSELLGSERMDEILKQLSARADMVIIDSPPMDAVTDAFVLAAHVDAVLFIIKHKQTPLLAAEQTLEQLRLAGANVIGLIMNDVSIKHGGYYYYAETY